MSMRKGYDIDIDTRAKIAKHRLKIALWRHKIFDEPMLVSSINRATEAISALTAALTEHLPPDSLGGEE